MGQTPCGGAHVTLVRETAIVELRGVSKYFGSAIALQDVSLRVHAGEVVCLLGDNGAGKSTLIKIIAGVHRQDSGTLLVDGREVTFSSAHDALSRGIATVYQDLAIMPLMSVSRNFFLGAEPTHRVGPFRLYDRRTADRIAFEELKKMGIELRDVSQNAGTLSGGERQSLAIARAIHFGARVVILDEPTSALGVKEAGVVLRYIVQARLRGIGVILITHNPTHAYPVGDTFTILDRGHMVGTYDKDELRPEELLTLMGGGPELQRLSSELEEIVRASRLAAADNWSFPDSTGQVSIEGR
jgi:simple sugar transport system ATP-binding protein